MRLKFKTMMLRLGLMRRPRVMTDAHRRRIRTMIDGGISDAAISEYFGYSPEEVAGARTADPISGAIAKRVS